METFREGRADDELESGELPVRTILADPASDRERIG
jgi:hypothetical protein